MSRRTQGIILLVIAFILLGFIAYKNTLKRSVPVIFSPRNELQSLWEQYKRDNFEQGTNRTLDKSKGFITTSEGQSYSMLRAVWVGDKTAFDQSWKWTKDNLQRPDDHLFSWLFGKKPNGQYGVLIEQSGQNTASDADSDIALALIFAAGRWNDSSYLNEAKLILNGMWQNDVMTIQGKPYLMADNVEKGSPSQYGVINPSYFSPYAYRVFAQVDPSHPWLKLVDTSYDVLNQSMTQPLDASSTAVIPPDWIVIHKKTGMLSATDKTLGTTTTTNMSYDALRVPWRITLDWMWNKEPRARDTLLKMSFLRDEWQARNELYTSYTHDGRPVVTEQTAAFYGGTIGYFMVADPVSAKKIYDNKLQFLFNPDSNTWRVPLGYYDDNWAWFGIALYNDLLPNLAQQ